MPGKGDFMIFRIPRFVVTCQRKRRFSILAREPFPLAYPPGLVANDQARRCKSMLANELQNTDRLPRVCA
jgi:hypothetical protein